MRRKLGKFESATAFSDETQVFNIVGVLFVEAPPSQEILQRAINILQHRHPFLKVRLVKSGKQYYFESGDVPGIPLAVLDRKSDDQWIGIVEQGVNQNLNRRKGPLANLVYLTDGDNKGEIILTFHHSIADGPSVVNIFDEIMKICASLHSGEQAEAFTPRDPIPPVEASFPPAYHGLGMLRKTMAYALREMGSELVYQYQTRGKQKYPIHQDARGRIIPMRIPEAETSAIIKRARKEGVTLYGALNAAMLQSVQAHLYEGEDMLLRYLVPGNLRPYLDPPAVREDLGCYVTMMRFTLPVRASDDLWSLARGISKQIYTASKGGEKYMASVTSEQVMRMLLTINKFRMCHTAVTYSGPIQLEQSYGPFKVKGLRGFTSNFGQGPEYSAQVSITNDELWWDILYLDRDMDHSLALRIADQIRMNLVIASRV